jgi:pimeloyl-ACP methyl ester carboxylesterase
MPSFLTDDGVRLDYLESGMPTARAVVLIAGFKAPATSWKAQQKSLVAAGYRVLALDQRGHGTSASGDPEHNAMPQYGADLVRFLEHLDLHDAVLVAFSIGGNVIWSAIEQGAGDRVAGVVIIDQTPKMLNTEDWPHGFYGYDESNRDTYFASEIPDPRQFPFLKKGPVRIARLLKRLDLGRTSLALLGRELALVHDHALADWRPVIAQSPKPVLFVAGAESEFWPSSHAAASAAIAPAGSSAVIPKAGHVANIEQPKAFNKVLLRFLAEPPVPASPAGGAGHPR